MKNLQTMKQDVQKGFTLIELMIVVAIIGILAALAIPAYQDYTIKSRVGEGASLSGSFKTSVDLYWSENGTLTDIGTGLSLTTLGLSSQAGQYVSALTIKTGPIIEVLMKDSTKLGEDVTDGGANKGCFEYFPERPDNAGGNLKWYTRGELAYTSSDGESIAAATCSLTGNDGPLPNKYMPKS